MSSLSSRPACSVLPIQPISDPVSQLSSVSINISHQASLEKIRPFPKAGSRKFIKGRKRQRTRILTDTPVRNELNRLQEMKKKSQSKKKKYETQNKIFMTRKRKLDLESNEKKNVESH